MTKLTFTKHDRMEKIARAIYCQDGRVANAKSKNAKRFCVEHWLPAAAPTRQFAARRDETVRVGQIVRRTYLKPSSFVPVTCVVFSCVYSVLAGRIFPMPLSRLLVLHGLNPLSLNLSVLQA